LGYEPIMTLALSPHVDGAKFAPIFQRFGRLHIPDVFGRAEAEAIHIALRDHAPYSQVFNAGAKIYDLSPQMAADLDPQTRRELDQAIFDGARDGFQFRFDSWRLSDPLEAGQRAGGPVTPLEAVWDFLNSEAFLGFARRMTGEPRIAFCDAQATRYRGGDLLTAHDDISEGKNRLFAYVLNFTPTWKADWGGLLAFLDADGHVSEAYTPAFNALNIFKVPQMHTVTQVTDFAGAPRLSITGWIRAR
jgi:Rps23 Pro-64 3,4-dihydroxylase Tpa1-like proline 4-hydroxylase